MSSENKVNDTLSYLWSGSHPIRRLLFFTYRFNFRWFHNEVLPFIRKRRSPNTEIDVFATRFDDTTFAGGSQEQMGNLYALDEWANRWQERLRVHYLPGKPHLFHNKFILAQFEKRSNVILGLGSSNLTSSGWMDNCEAWVWDTQESLPACREFLIYLQRFPEVGNELLAPWIREIRVKRLRSPQIRWLYGNKRKARQLAFESLTHGLIGKPTILRVVSPYYDVQSAALLKELLSIIKRQNSLPDHVDLWVDGSGHIARRSDYKCLLNLLNTPGVKVELKSLATKPERSQLKCQTKLHAKVIELEDEHGDVRRIVGSANFTGAAWIRNGNTETIMLDRDTRTLSELIPSNLIITPLSKSALRNLIDSSEEADEQPGSMKRWVYWASFDECKIPPILTVSYESYDPPTEVRVRAKFDPRHMDLSPQRAESICNAFEDPQNWHPPVIDNHVLTMTLKNDTIQFPEFLSVLLRFKDGKTISGHVEATNPNFEQRDGSSGIPLDLSVLENVLGGRTTIVRPLPNGSTMDRTEGDDSVEEEEDFIEPPYEPESLSDDPDFHHEPPGVKYAKALREASRSPVEWARFKRRLSAIKPKIVLAREKVLVDALEITMKNWIK